MTTYGRWTTLGGVGIALLALACTDTDISSAPRAAALSHPATTAAQLQAIDGVVKTPALQSLTAMSANLPAVAPAGLAPAAALVGATTPGYARAARRGEALRQALPPLGNGAMPALFKPSVLGKTFVWDETARRYVQSDRAGAPTTGVRLILYAIDPLTQRPSSPPVEIGYADLIDNSSGGTTTLEVIIVGTTEPSPETYGDYTISGTFGGSSAKGTAAGYVTDGATRVDFTMSLDASSTKTTFNSVFDVGPQGVHITFDATMVPRSPSTLTVAVDFHMSSRSETVTASGPLTVTSSGSGDTVSGTLGVQVNGRDFATITLAGSQATFQGAGGQPLSPEDLQALKQLYEVPQDVLAALENAVTPVEVAFHLQ